MEVGAGAGVQVLGRVFVVNGSRQLFGPLRQRLAEQADVLECRELIRDAVAVIVVAIRLKRVDAENVLRGHGVAEGALGATGKVPDLVSRTARGLRVLDRVRLVETLPLD